MRLTKRITRAYNRLRNERGNTFSSTQVNRVKVPNEWPTSQEYADQGSPILLDPKTINSDSD